MRKSMTMLAGLLLLSGSVFAQKDKFMFHGGFCYDFYSLQARFTAQGEGWILPFYGLTGGVNYVLVHSNDQVSLLANANASVAYSGGYGASFMVQAPVYLLARYGAGATAYNEKKIGVGLGAGGSFNYLYSNAFLPSLNHSFIVPSAVAEVSVNGRSSFYSIRFHWPLAKAMVKWGGTDYLFSNFGLSVNYSF